MDKQITEAPKEKTWGALADEAMHNPYVDIAVGAAVGAAVVLSRGKLAGVAESLFPKASSLLGESSQVGKATGLQAETEILMRSTLLSRSTEELVSLAGSAKVSPSVLDTLAGHFSPDVLEGVAKNKLTTTGTLMKLSDSAAFTPNLAKSMASNPNATGPLLEKLSEHAPLEVAGHPNALPGTLEKLATKTIHQPLFETDQLHLDIREEVAKNRNTSPETLTTLFNNKNGSYQELQAILTNPNTPSKLLESAVQPDSLFLVSDEAKKASIQRLAMIRDGLPVTAANRAAAATEISLAGHDLAAEVVGSVPAKLADVPQIMESGVSNYTRATIPEIVEAPLVKASTQLYDKNIRTVFSGANGINNGPGAPAYIHIDYETLSDANKAIAQRLGKIHPANAHSGTTIAALELPVAATSSVSHIEAEFLKMSAQFERQPLTWGHWSADEFKDFHNDVFRIENGADFDVKDAADSWGYSYIPKLSRVFQSEEHAAKYEESLHW